MKKLYLPGLALAMAAGFMAPANSAVVTIASPGPVTNEIGARLRWGASGQEAGILDGGSLSGTNLNPAGSPAWVLNTGYKFEISFSSSTGALDLKVDFNNDNAFGTGEFVTQSGFTGTTNYSGLGFNYLQIFANESGSTGRSNLSNLKINGTSFGPITPNGASSDIFFDDNSGALFGSVLIEGTLTFTTVGTGQERPSWSFNLLAAERLPVQSVAEPGSMALVGLAFVGLAVIRRRKSYTQDGVRSQYCLFR